MRAGMMEPRAARASGYAPRSGRDGLVDVDARDVLADDVANVLACAGYRWVAGNLR
jgi:hypothetical protein